MENNTAFSNQYNPSAILMNKLNILMEINQAVSRKSDLDEALQAALMILRDSYGIYSGAIFLNNPVDNVLHVAARIGFPESSHIDKVPMQSLSSQTQSTGRPIIIPRISKEPTYVEGVDTAPKTGKDLSYFGLPISLDMHVLGVLAIGLPYNAGRDYDRTLKFLSLVASALLQPIRLKLALTAEKDRLAEENVRLKQKLQEEFSFHNIIGNSHEMRDVFEQTAHVSRTQTTVLIRGESGTGKELIAEAIHYNSERSNNAFIRVNCGAIPETLIESEFFGYEKGAFTGADSRKKGRFELADKGTIFLDEIGELSSMTQVKLLRVLQEQVFERVGGTESIKVDVRILAATNADLEALMQSGQFREDLYYRLNVFSIYLPPLRERKTDILLLADHFMLKYGRQHAKAIKRISTPAIDMLMRYHWPGNVRELENCIERAAIVCEDQVIHSYHLPPTLQTAESSSTMPKLSLDEAVASYEKGIIEDALKSARGNRAKAARLLNTTERIMGYKIHKYDIDPKRFKM